MNRVEGRRAGGAPGTAAKVPERQGHRRLAYLVLGAALPLAPHGALGARGGAWGMSTVELAV